MYAALPKNHNKVSLPGAPRSLSSNSSATKNTGKNTTAAMKAFQRNIDMSFRHFTIIAFQPLHYRKFL